MKSQQSRLGTCKNTQFVTVGSHIVCAGAGLYPVEGWGLSPHQKFEPPIK